MTTLADAFFDAAPLGKTVVLPRAGSALENVYVYDACAREVKRRADAGAAEIVDERRAFAGDDEIILSLAFRRLR